VRKYADKGIVAPKLATFPKLINSKLEANIDPNNWAKI
jgi:hypothetical protein